MIHSVTDGHWTTWFCNSLTPLNSFTLLVLYLQVQQPSFDLRLNYFRMTDMGATNYDDCANTDDGSCIYPCTDNISIICMIRGARLECSTYDISTGGVLCFTGGLLFELYGSDTLVYQYTCWWYRCRWWILPIRSIIWLWFISWIGANLH